MLLVAARSDDMVPLATFERAHAVLRAGELEVFDCGHFDLYIGREQPASAARQAAFLVRCLSPTRDVRRDPSM